MSNSLLDTVLHYGTNAQRLAFVPDPPVVSGAAVQVLYVWQETDTGKTWVFDTAWHQIAGSGIGPIRSVGITIDGGGSVITAGLKGFVQIPFSGTIQSWTILSSDAAGPATAGSIVVDLWKVPYASAPPTVANSITASAPPTMTSANKATSSTLTGWATTVTAGDVVAFNVVSAALVTRVDVQVAVQ